MAIFTLKQKIFIVKRYYQCGNSTKVVQNEYPREFFDSGDKPTDESIIELINLFEEFGSVLKYRKKSLDIDLEDAEESVYLNFEIKQEIDPLSNDGTESYLETKNNTDFDEKLDIGVKKLICNIIPCGPEINPFSNDDTKSETKNNVDENLCIGGVLVTAGPVEVTENKYIPCGKGNIVVSKDDRCLETNSNVDFDEQLNIKDASSSMDSEEETINNDFPCNQCERIFKTKGAFSNHMRIHKQECNICKKNCSIMELAKHTEYPSSDCNVQVHEDGDLKTVPVVHSTDKVHWCCLCKKSFKTRIRLKAHERTHLTDQERPQKCDICGKGFLKKYALQLHAKTHGEKRGKDSEASQIDSHICDICGQALSSKMSLTNHMRRHTGERPHQCPFCDKNYSQITTLMHHKQSHTGAKPFTCNICGKSVTTRNSLKNHKDIVHGGAKPFQCTFCGNKFTSWTGLKYHKRIHTGERPYSCQHCSKEFYDPGTFRRHLRTHTGEKPYKCKICEKAFSQQGNLTIHLKNVHKQEHTSKK